MLRVFSRPGRGHNDTHGEDPRRRERRRLRAALADFHAAFAEKNKAMLYMADLMSTGNDAMRIKKYSLAFQAPLAVGEGGLVPKSGRRGSALTSTFDNALKDTLAARAVAEEVRALYS